MADGIPPEDRDAVTKAMRAAQKSATRRAGISRTRKEDGEKAIKRVEKNK